MPTIFTRFFGNFVYNIFWVDGFTCIARILARVSSGLPFTDTWYVVGHRREDHQNNPAYLVYGEGVTRNESNYLGAYIPV